MTSSPALASPPWGGAPPGDPPPGLPAAAFAYIASASLWLRLHLRALVRADLLPDVFQHALGLVHERVGAVADIGFLALAAVFLREALGFLDHLVHLVFGQSGRPRDLDRLLAAGRGVPRLRIEDAVGVDVERHLDLGHPARRPGDAVQDEAPQRAVVAGNLPLALQDVDLNLR